MEKFVSVYEAKTKLSQILDEVSGGQIFIVTKHGKPIAEIIPTTLPKGVQLGALSHLIKLDPDFDIDAIDISHLWAQWEENNEDLGK
jgi:prevent-host-death family protein